MQIHAYIVYHCIADLQYLAVNLEFIWMNLDIFDMDVRYFVMDLAKLEAKVVADVTRLFWVSLLFRWQDSQLAE